MLHVHHITIHTPGASKDTVIDHREKNTFGGQRADKGVCPHTVVYEPAICCKLIMQHTHTHVAVSVSVFWSSVTTFFMNLPSQTQWKVNPCRFRLCNVVKMVPSRFPHFTKMIMMDAMDAGHTKVNLDLLFSVSLQQLNRP